MWSVATSHQPKKEVYENEQGQCTYLIWGLDKINLTAFGYTFKPLEINIGSSFGISFPPSFADEEIKGMDIMNYWLLHPLT